MILTWGEIEWDKYLSRYIYVHMNGYSPPVKTQGLEFDTLMWPYKPLEQTDYIRWILLLSFEVKYDIWD